MRRSFLLCILLCVLSACGEDNQPQNLSNQAPSVLQKTEAVENDKGVLENAFSQYVWMDIKNIGRFGYEQDAFNPVNQPVDNLPSDDVCYSADNEENYILLGRYHNKTMEQEINILASPGPSTDPFFEMRDASCKQAFWGNGGEEMAINNSGKIYTANRTNQEYNRRLIWRLKGDKVEQIAQPALYVAASRVK